MNGVADAFELFELAPSFELDLDDLTTRHREISLALHPDRYSANPAPERRAALSRAIEVNDAKRKLMDPIQRAELLLARLGAPVGEGREPAAAPDLLMEMMERREALREAAMAHDRQAIDQLSAAVRLEEKQTLAQMGELFQEALHPARSTDEVVEATDQSTRAAGPSATGNSSRSPKLDQLLRHLGALRYYRRFFDEAGAALDDLD